MKLIIVSGRSGSGKSTVLRALEDEGYEGIDNFPVLLLQSLVHHTLRNPEPGNAKLAVCIDARSRDLERFPEILLSLDRMDVDCQVIFLDARSPTLVKRFSETRRRHPLTHNSFDLRQAIDAETEVLESIADVADLTIDTTQISSQELRTMVSERVASRNKNTISLLFRSFGFKKGVPVDADMVFDLRCLPNPHWEPTLRALTGLDQPVQDYLNQEAMVDEMFNDVSSYLSSWIPRFEDNARVYMTIALGCTGGQHRSVYFAERLATHFRPTYSNLLVRHRETPIATTAPDIATTNTPG